MKRFRWFIALSALVYIGMSILFYVLLVNSNNTNSNIYRVSINRVLQEIKQDNNFEAKLFSQENKSNDVEQIFYVNTNDYSYTKDILRITYISTKAEKQSVKEEFYKQWKSCSMEIVPVVREDGIEGYLRFDYNKEFSMKPIIYLVEGTLAAAYIIILMVLLYLKINILNPFNKFSKIPYDIAKGNLAIDVKEQKNKYFGKFIWGIGMLRDSLTMHKNRELKLTKDKKVMILTISHDIKTPLNTIMLYAKAIEGGMYKTESEIIETAKNIQSKAGEINNFVNDIVKSASEDIISIEVDKNKEFYVKNLLQMVNEGYRERCQIRHLSLEIERMDNVIISGDIDRAYETIGNIIENAIKYGDGKQIKIYSSEEEYCLLIHIFNTGKPISKNEMPHLFDSFFRGSNSDGKAGNGLGLYICSQIMKKMDGEIYAQYHEEGMEFVLVFKIV